MLFFSRFPMERIVSMACREAVYRKPTAAYRAGCLFLTVPPRTVVSTGSATASTSQTKPKTPKQGGLGQQERGNFRWCLTWHSVNAFSASAGTGSISILSTSAAAAPFILHQQPPAAGPHSAGGIRGSPAAPHTRFHPDTWEEAEGSKPQEGRSRGGAGGAGRPLRCHRSSCGLWRPWSSPDAAPLQQPGWCLGLTPGRAPGADFAWGRLHPR